MMRIERVSVRDCDCWSDLWQRQISDHVSLRRSDPEFFRYKYCRENFSFGVKGIANNSGCGYFAGILTRLVMQGEKPISVAEISDLIADPTHKTRGAFRDFLHELIHTRLREYEAVIFLPINRTALLTLRMHSPTAESVGMRTWTLFPDSECFGDKPGGVMVEELGKGIESLSEFSEITDFIRRAAKHLALHYKSDEFIRWRYVEYPEKHYLKGAYINGQIVGYCIYRIVNISGVRGVEITDLLVDETNCATRNNGIITSAMIESLFPPFPGFVRIRAMAGSEIDVCCSKYSPQRKIVEEGAAVIVYNGKKVFNIIGNLPFTGEELDVPRWISYLNYYEGVNAYGYQKQNYAVYRR